MKAYFVKERDQHTHLYRYISGAMSLVRLHSTSTLSSIRLSSSIDLCGSNTVRFVEAEYDVID
jgi:hypothetical protein